MEILIGASWIDVFVSWEQWTCCHDRVDQFRVDRADHLVMFTNVV